MTAVILNRKEKDNIAKHVQSVFRSAFLDLPSVDSITSTE